MRNKTGTVVKVSSLLTEMCSKYDFKSNQNHCDVWFKSNTTVLHIISKTMISLKNITGIILHLNLKSILVNLKIRVTNDCGIIVYLVCKQMSDNRSNSWFCFIFAETRVFMCWLIMFQNIVRLAQLETPQIRVQKGETLVFVSHFMMIYNSFCKMWYFHI